MTNPNRPTMKLDNLRNNYGKGTTADSRNKPKTKNGGNILPPPVVETVIRRKLRESGFVANRSRTIQIVARPRAATFPQLRKKF